MRRPAVLELRGSIDVHLADARKRADICTAFTGCDVVVNAIGAGTLRHNDVESSTTAAAVAAAEEVGVHRYIAMSAGMVALDWFVFKYMLRPLIFRNIYAEHRRVEDLVRASSLAWTIVRPPKLTNGAPRGYVAGLKLQSGSYTVARAGVATFIADELDNKEYVRKAVFIASGSVDRR
jgi:uncharacterized protein YbjT (DUF2867 family)